MRSLIFERKGLSPRISSTPNIRSSAIRPHRWRVLWCDRTDRKRRYPAQWDELRGQIEKRFRQVATFHSYAGTTNATAMLHAAVQHDVFVGPHGANLAPIVWARTGSQLIEIRHPCASPACYCALAAALGLGYWSVSPARVKPEHLTSSPVAAHHQMSLFPTDLGNFTVNWHDLEEAFASAFAALSNR